MDKDMRRKLIAYLEIPVHKSLQTFMFYDVLSICCRYTCETSHKIIKRRRKELEYAIGLEMKLKKKSRTPAQIKDFLNKRMREDPQCVALFHHMFVTK